MLAKELFEKYSEPAPLTTGQNSRLFEQSLRRIVIPAPTPKTCAISEKIGQTSQPAKQKRKRLFVVYENIGGEEKGIFSHAQQQGCQEFVDAYLQSKPSAKLQISTSPELTHPIK